jgi:hypothetical protein
MNTNCPLFKIGTCKGYITRECKYKYHKKCKDNFLCSDENCILGHGISFIKRTILINIYNKHSDIDTFNNSDDKCSIPLVCSKSDCKLQHFLEYKDRQNIIYIINTCNVDKDAWNYYIKKYENTKETIEPKKTIISIKTPHDIKYYSSSNSSKSYADLVRCNIIEDTYITDTMSDIVISDNSNIIEDDCITDTMDDLIEESKEIKKNTNKIESIKKQIIELQLSLEEYENNIKTSNDKLRDLANKIVKL